MPKQTLEKLTATCKTVVIANTTTVLLAANPNRRQAYITNVSDEIVGIGLDTAAVASSGYSIGALTAGGPLDRYQAAENGQVFQGAINGITASGTKSVAVVEFE